MSVAVCGRPEIDPVAREQRMRGLFEATAVPLRRYLVRLTQGQPDAAEDLLQETMLRAWRKVDDLPEDAESLRRWIFTVARNVAIDAVRTRMARPTEVYSDRGPWAATADEDIDRLLDRQMLRDALSRLSERHRGVLLALYGRDISVADAAESLGIPEGTVRSRSFYALRSVRDILGGSDPHQFRAGDGEQAARAADSRSSAATAEAAMGDSQARPRSTASTARSTSAGSKLL
uniref:sigma-70 family RNA polymerase sigma factor n=1 Tax=Paractinoplanes polyasparticus TaxID=2856853 RepID=UPI001C855218|nr:sigma-70 family RNA polymerase sigma factor [Actinoplanes polyasparticus]